MTSTLTQYVDLDRLAAIRAERELIAAHRAARDYWQLQWHITGQEVANKRALFYQAAIDELSFIPF